MNTNQSKPMPLRTIVTELLSRYAQVNTQSSSRIVNAVPPEILITRSKNWLAPLMGDLFSILSSANDNETVYISAKSVRGEIKLHISKRKTEATLSVSQGTSKQLLPTLNILPAKFHFGFRA